MERNYLLPWENKAGRVCTIEGKGQWLIVNATSKRATVRLFDAQNVIARNFTYCWDGQGYKRQGEYLTA